MFEYKTSSAKCDSCAVQTKMDINQNSVKIELVYILRLVRNHNKVDLWFGTLC
jgi:hypothetical protein